MEVMRTLLVYLTMASIVSWPLITAQPPSNSSRRSLDVLLQNYAYEAMGTRPRTGKVYDAQVPSNFSGMTLAALRLRSGSLKNKGVNFKNITFPPQVITQPYVVRLVVVYQNLGNWSSTYYGISGYTFLAPVVGLLAYDGSNLSATNLQELDMRALGKRISIQFTDVRKAPYGSTPKCVFLHLNGSYVLSNLTSPSSNLCSATAQGHYSILVESIAPSPAPISPPSIAPISPPSVVPSSPSVNPGSEKDKWRVWKIAAPVIGGSALLVLLVVLVLCLRKCNQHKKMEEMEMEADMGEALQMRSIGDSKAPMAFGTRTPPMLETEYTP